MNCWYLYSVICGLIGLIMFLYGFFLVNYDRGKVLSSHLSHTPPSDAGTRSRVAKTVMVVIDALRYDFIDGNDTFLHWPYLYSLIEQKQACVFPCRVHLPTVTMPRIKAMTVGDASNFLDIVLNLGSSQIKHDNIIEQMKRKGMKIVFYGDDTWIKLFPNSFYRQEGVSSFFVSDFYEVDNIVTRNVEAELKRSDWDVMILHYLGLDHIGHVEGPKSSKIPLKLKEMDSVIEKLHNYLLLQKTSANESYLLIICADHGMRNSGGHGGSSIQETLVPLISIGVNCTSSNEVSQVDLAVTLSLLMGLPIPYESIGKVIPQFLELLPVSEKVDLYRRVTRHLIKKYIRVVGPLERDLENEFATAHILIEQSAEKACKAFQFLSHRLSTTLVSFLTKFDISYLLIAVFISVQASLLPLTSNKSAFNTLYKSLPLTASILALILIDSYFHRYLGIICNLSKDNVFIVCSITLLIIFNVVHLFQARKLMIGRLLSAVSVMKSDCLSMFLTMGLLLQILSPLSTSLIEEEHMYWYFMWTSWLMLLLCQNFRTSSAISIVALLILHRILKKFNQTGDQYASLPDIGDWFNNPERKLHLTIFLLFELLCVAWSLRYRIRRTKLLTPLQTMKDIFLSIDKFLDIICIILVFLYRAAIGDVAFFEHEFLSNNGFLVVQVFKYLMIITALLKSAKCFLGQQNMEFIDVCIELWTLITILVMRPHNVILPGALMLTSKWVTETMKLEHSNEMKIVVSHYWLAHVYFFYQGNSNSLATIDVASGYIGLSEFSMTKAGLMIAVSTYSMPILAYMLMFKEIQKLRKIAMEPVVQLLLVFINVNLTFYFIVMILQRHHLFIWSVFSPKLLYVSIYYLILYPVVIFALYMSQKR